MDDRGRNGSDIGSSEMTMDTGSSESTTMFSSSDFSDDSFDDLFDGLDDEHQDIPLSNIVDVYKDVNSLVSSKQAKKDVGMPQSKPNDIIKKNNNNNKRKIKLKVKRSQVYNSLPEKHRKTTISLSKRDRQKKQLVETAQDHLRKHGLGDDDLKCFDDDWKSKDRRLQQLGSNNIVNATKDKKKSLLKASAANKIVSARRIYKSKKNESLVQGDRYDADISNEDSFRDDESDKRNELAGKYKLTVQSSIS